GKGSIFQDYEDKGQVVEYDAMKLTIKNKYSTPGCDAPVGMARDKVKRRRYVGCRGKGPTAPGVLIVMNADNGKVVSSMPIGIGVDGDVFDPATGNVFAA